MIDLIRSVRHYEGSDIKIVVADDLTGEYPDEFVRRKFPEVDFITPRIASGSSYCAFRTLQPALLHLVRSYRVPAVLKCDPDTLMIGSGAFDRALERFRAEPRLGMLGTTVLSSSTKLTDPRWVIWMAHPEIRWSRRFHRLVADALAGVPELNFAQAGACFISSRAIHAALEQGWLPYRQPQWSLQVNDVIMGLVVQAAGFTIDSFGADDPIASDNRCLPLEPEELVRRGYKVVHSVRSSPCGMSEAQIRAFFRDIRAHDRSSGVAVR